MSVDQYTYCVATDVAVFVGDIVPGRVFSPITSPKQAEVEEGCDNVAAIIHAKLAEEGYPNYTSAVLLATYPLVQSYLKALNVYGACA